MRFYLYQKSFLSCIFGILGKKDLDSGFILSILRRKGNLGKSLKAKTDLQSLEGKNINVISRKSLLLLMAEILLLYCTLSEILPSGSSLDRSEKNAKSPS